MAARSASEREITIHSSWRGLIFSTLGAAIVAAAGTFGVIAAGFRVVPGTLFVVGWLFVLIVALDYPVASRFTAEGVERRMMLRRQWFPWERVDQLTRTRPSFVKLDRRIEHGGLTVKIGRKRYLLVDRLESGDEFDAMVRIVEVPGTAGDEVGASMLPRPGDKVPPTWMYRRRRWRPEWATDR